MSKKLKLGVLASVLLVAGLIFWGQQLLQYFNLTDSGEEITQNILAVLQAREKENKPVFIDFYGAY